MSSGENSMTLTPLFAIDILFLPDSVAIKCIPLSSTMIASLPVLGWNFAIDAVGNWGKS